MLGYLPLVLCVLHYNVYCHTEDESILLHTLKKRDLAEQLGPIPFRQRGEDPPQPITDAAGVYGHTAVLNPNLEDDGQHDPLSSVAGGSFAAQNPSNRQPSSDRTQGDSQAPTYDYRQASDSQSYSSQGGESYGGTRTYNSGSSYGSQSSGTPSQGSSRTYSSSVQETHVDDPDDGDDSQRISGSSRSRSQTDTRYSSQTHSAGGAGAGAGGATATYSPTGTRRQNPTQTGTGRQHQSGGTGPTGRRPSVAASYPLGPILSTGGGQPQYTNRQQTYTGRQVYRQSPSYRNTNTRQPTYTSGQTYTAVRQPQYSGGQPTYTAGQPTYTAGSQSTYSSGGQSTYRSGQPTYAGHRTYYAGQPTYSGGQPTYSGGQPTYTAGRQPYYTGSSQYTYTSGQQPVYNVGSGQTGQGYVPHYPQGGGQYPYNPSPGNCPDTGIRMRINGMDCERAVDFYGPFLCYRHEATSRECCEKCQPLKNPSNVGCEYGDHSYQCRQIQAHDCYDLRNRQGCCATCDRLRVGGEAGCEYGDMTPRCQRVSQNPSLCYIPENQRLCCSTCRRLRGDNENQVCPWGDQNSNLCRPFDNFGGIRINCYAEPIRRLCCQTCERLKSRMPPNLVGCEYGDRPVVFNTGEYGSLNCTSFFRHFPVEQCQLNQAVSINCCYTCHRYQAPRQRQAEPGTG